MDLVQSLLSFLQKNPAPTTEEAPAGYCPNCWGREEYGGQFYEAVKNDKVDVNSTDSNVGWVADYANKHLQGIALQPQGDQLVCQKCKLTYQPK